MGIERIQRFGLSRRRSNVLARISRTIPSIQSPPMACTPLASVTTLVGPSSRGSAPHTASTNVADSPRDELTARHTL
jgi:hypothetical protein